MKVKSGHEIGRTGGVREYVNEDVDGDFLDIDCYGEEFSGVVLRGQGVGGKVDVEDGAVNEGDEFSTTHSNRTVLTDSGVVGE